MLAWILAALLVHPSECPAPLPFGVMRVEFREPDGDLFVAEYRIPELMGRGLPL